MGISNDPSKGEPSKYLTKHTIREQFKNDTDLCL
jgi:hypothetical protein